MFVKTGSNEADLTSAGRVHNHCFMAILAAEIKQS